MTDYFVSLLRTYVPLAWGTALAFLVNSQIIDAQTAQDAAPFATSVLVPVAAGVVYALARLLEPHLPKWLVVVLLGSSKAPNYAADEAKGRHSA